MVDNFMYVPLLKKNNRLIEQSLMKISFSCRVCSCIWAKSYVPSNNGVRTMPVILHSLQYQLLSSCPRRKKEKIEKCFGGYIVINYLKKRSYMILNVA